MASTDKLADFHIKFLNTKAHIKCKCTPPSTAACVQNTESGPDQGRWFYKCRNTPTCGFNLRETVATSPSSGLIQALPKSRYDSLIQDNPKAALTYVDEDDGEIITVGSAYELEQRLRDPVDPSSAPKPAPDAVTIHPHDLQLLHSFSLSSSEQQVRHLWQCLQTPQSLFPPNTTPLLTTDRDRSLLNLRRAPSPAAPADDSSTSQKPKSLIELFEVELAKLAPPKEQKSEVSLPNGTTDSATLAASAAPAAAPITVAKPETPAAPAAPVTQAAPAAPAAPAEVTTSDVPAAAATEPQQPASFAADPEISVPQPAGATPASPGAIFANTLQSLITGLGSLAARVDERNPQIREQILQAQTAGQEAALGVLSRLVPEIQSRAVASGVRPPASRRVPSPAAETTVAAPASPSRSRSYEAERILASRYICYDNLHNDGARYRQYLVRWAGCGPADDVWYDEDNLKTSCQPLIDYFERTRSLSPMSVHESAMLHRRTAGNRMMASASLRTGSNSSNVSDPRPAAAPLRQEPAGLASSGRAAQNQGRGYSFDPADIMTHEISGPTLRRVTSALPSYSQSTSTPHDATEPSNLRSQDTPLRRVKSLAFRHLPSGVSERQGAPAESITETSESAQQQQHPLPHLRRAMTTARAERRHHGFQDSRDTLFNHFEASRGRYLPRRAATARMSHRAAEHRQGHFQESDKIMRCTNDLVNMGYRRSEAEPVAAICDGDVSKALDQLEEDRKAWLWRSNREDQEPLDEEHGGNMPGAWDVYRW